MHEMASGTNPGQEKTIRWSPVLENKMFLTQSSSQPSSLIPIYTSKQNKRKYYTMPITSADATEPQVSQQNNTNYRLTKLLIKQALQGILNGLKALFKNAQSGDVVSWEHMNGVTEELLKALEFKKDDDPWWHNMKRAHTKSKEGLEDLKRAIDDGAGI